MKKKTELVIHMTATKRDLNVKNVSKTKKQILSYILSEVKESSKHFRIEDGGWKLNKDCINSDIINKVIGFDIINEISQAFINEGLMVEFSSRGSFVRTKEEYMPIYMNEKTGKIHLVENSDDKTYIDRFSKRNGYVEIGKL
jgi:mannosyltransferase OCH1-like enzyme